jgi:hypothetical protein
VPASGDGALTTAVRYGTEIIASPMLVGIPASGTGSILYAIPQGEPVNIITISEDAAAQTERASVLGSGHGVREDVLQDSRLSITGAQARGDAHLELVATPLTTVTYETPDASTRSGREVTITYTQPAVSGTFKIQRVTYQGFDARGRIWPQRSVEVSSRRFSFEALLRKVLNLKGV